MPATLDQAFRSPFHNNVEQTTNSSMNSVKNPDYYSFQKDYTIKKADDIESEAEDLKSIYNSVPEPSNTIINDDQCNLLIAQVLASPKCRSRLRELLIDDDKATQSDDEPQNNQANQSGGGYHEWNWSAWKNIISNIILAIALIAIIDIVFGVGIL